MNIAAMSSIFSSVAIMKNPGEIVTIEQHNTT
jgi:hypothetical protein